MAIEIKETFRVRAPLDRVWRFVMDPRKVVTCMPGAALEEVVDDRTFVGSVKVKVGAITTSYVGRVQFSEIDERQHRVQLSAEGREAGGGTAKGTLSSQLRSLSAGETEIVAEARVDLTGRIMQVGRGMIQGVAHQLFQQFVARTQRLLEAEPGPAGEAAETASAPAENEAIRIVPLLLQMLRDAVGRFFRRLFGRREG